LAERIARIPFHIFHGELDPVIPPVHSRDMHKALLQAGGKSVLTVYSTLGHALWQETYYNPEVMGWLFGQRKE
jgi:predicted esterase